MKDYSRIISKITTTPWMMMPASLQMMLDIIDAHIDGRLTKEAIQANLAAAPPRESKPRQGAIGVIPLHGPIFPRANMMTEMSGATSLEEWRQEFQALVDDESISSIVMDIDSPGGSSDLIPEVMDQIRAARDVKPIYAAANTMAASAAYGLAAQATEFYASPSSLVGSIGTYMVHTDDSELMQKIGVQETVIKAGRFKAVELEKLTPEAKAYLESLVGDINQTFVNRIALGRKTTPDNILSTEAKVFTAEGAMGMGLVDGIASFDEVVANVMEGGSRGTSIGVGNGVPGSRQSYDADKEHSEPGTGLGGEPTPREPPEEDDPAIEGGWRRDPPPPAYETEEVVNREWLEARATALGIEFNSDTSDEDLAQSVAEQTDSIVAPLAAATADAERQREFAEAYPEQATQLADLLTRERQSSAQSFADGYARFEGSKKGYAPVVRESIKNCHERIQLRQFTTDDLKSLLDAVTSDTAVVEYDEKGSSRSDETATVAPINDVQKDRQAFANLVRQAMQEDNLTREKAIEHVSTQHPELARAYAVGHVR